MKKILLSLLMFIALAKTDFAQSLTWANDIAPILYQNCVTCHRPGGLGPFSLLTYADAYNHMASIETQVQNRTMPPWPPDPTYRRMAHERILSGTDIHKIVSWIDGDAAQGDLNQAPTPPTFNNNSVLDTISLSLVIPAFTVPNNQTTDLYRCFALPTGLLQNMHITQMEVIPGNNSIVHHVLVFMDTTGQAITLDANDPQPGYTSFGGIGTSKSTLLGGWVPGAVSDALPAGTGIKIYGNSTVVLQIHYPAGSAGKTDSTRVNFKLTANTVRDLFVEPALNYGSSIINYNHVLSIPADSVRTFVEHYQVPNGFNVSGIGVAPHCHLLGKNWVSFGVTPTHDTIPFIKINNWDFHWQGFYQMRTVVKMPAGTDLYALCTYDNTSNNPNNPNTPPRLVTAGEATTDEMMLVYFTFMLYQPGDENIVIDNSPLVDLTDTFHTDTTTAIHNISDIVVMPQLYDASPNPATQQTTFDYYLPAGTNATLKIYDLSGKLVDEIKVPQSTGFNSVKYNTANLTPGTYLYNLTGGGQNKTKQLVITR